ncbi:hypothetical protein ABPG77_000263 [Micractinium sp. CCAP 211/92]
MKLVFYGRRLLRDDPLRRAVNEAAASCDCLAYVFLAAAFSLLLVLKTWLREGLPRLALLAASHSLLAALLAALTAHRRRGRQLYMSYRELLFFVVCLHCQWTTRLLALHGGVNTIDHHGGSALRLLGLLAGHTSVLYVTMYMLYARPLWPASGLTLACMAATSLWAGKRMCVRVLEAPGVEAPLGELVSMLSLANSVPAPPFVPSMVTELVKDPMQQCQAVSAWLVLAVGTALPLAMLCALERRTRRHWLARRQQQQQQQQQQEQQHGGGNADGLEAQRQRKRRGSLARAPLRSPWTACRAACRCSSTS